MAASHSNRSHSRVPVSCFLYYLGEGLVRTGKICDLPEKGWRIQGDEPVSVGRKLILRVFLPDQPRAIDVEGVLVQGVNGRQFGLEIVHMNAATEARIREFVTTTPRPASDSPSAA